MASAYTQLFLELSNHLQQGQNFWRESAFYFHELPWQQEWPQLHHAVLTLSEQEFEQLSDSPEALHNFLAKYIPAFSELSRLLAVPFTEKKITLEKRLNVDVPGRKWAQIKSFISALPTPISKASSLQNTSSADTPNTVVDWCSGKSYLGRALAHHWQCNLHAIERQSNLCQTGLSQAKRWTKANFTCKDVLLEPHKFNSNDYVVALHACGDLHRSLIQQWRTSESSQLALAPCCYHLWIKEEYQPLSLKAQTHNLNLNKIQMHLAVQEMVKASAAIRKRLSTIAEWRMAFDLIQRDIRADDRYMPTPSLPYSCVKLGPETVIRKLAEIKSVELPIDLNFLPYLEKAKQRYAQFKRLQLVNQGFRRALEMWLALDLVLYLEEANCKVSMKCFCSRPITPRNLILLASR